MCGPLVRTAILRTDAEILAETLAAEPQAVSIDSPLSRPAEGIIRESERELMALRVGVYPCLLPSMRALTERGIALRAAIERHGIPVIEGFPGAAQDALGIPRKQTDPAALRAGLAGFGLDLPGGPLSHHELDAATAALIGQFFLRDRYHAFGLRDEIPIVVPLVDRGLAAVRLTAPDPATHRYAVNYLAFFHGVRDAPRGRAVSLPACRSRARLREWLTGLVLDLN